MEAFLQILFSGLTLGAMYALSAVGLTLLWGVVGMLLATPITAVMKIFLNRFDGSRPLATALIDRRSARRERQRLRLTGNDGTQDLYRALGRMAVVVAKVGLQ